MSRLFLTNIDLNTNELQNAVIQNLSSAPQSGNKEGRIYYDVTAKALYLYTNGTWKQLASGGAAASSIELTGDVTGTASVDPATGKLTVSTTVDSSFVTKTGTQDLSNKRIIDTLYFTDGITINNEGEIAVRSGSHDFDIQANYGDLHLKAVATNSDVKITSQSGDIILNAGGNSYIGSVAAGNRIATIDDLNSDTVIQSVSGTTNQIDVSNTAGDVTISLPSTIQVSDLSIGNGSGSAITLNNASGNIEINPDSGKVIIDSNLDVNNISAIGGIASPDLTLSSGGGNVNINSNGTVVIGGTGTLQVTGNAQFDENVTITGNLNVTGTLNAVNRTEINIEDNTIRLNTGFTGAPTADAGIIVERGTANDTAIIWSETNDQWTLTNDGSNYYAIARKYVEVIGDASNTSFDVVHNLGTRDITVMVRENNAEYNVVETDILMKDGNTVTIAFTDAPALNAYKVIIVG